MSHIQQHMHLFPRDLTLALAEKAAQLKFSLKGSSSNSPAKSKTQNSTG